MKRSKHIDLEMMRKSAGKSLMLRPLALAIAAITLSACSGQEEVKVVSSVEDCLANTELSRDDCDAAYMKAQAEADRTGPKYNSMRTCESEFGRNQCRQNNGGVFMPMMTGFMVGQMLSGGNRFYNPVYRYSGSSYAYNNRLMTADGAVIGRPGQSSYRVDSANTKPKPRTTRTVSRGGFGAIASAKSNWGGGRSSGGWGG